MTSIQSRARAALEPVASALQADGYRLTVERDGPQEALRIRITATPDACADCLAPKPVIQPMIEQLLGADGVAPEGLELIYPNE